MTFGSDLDSPDLHDLDISFSEFVAPYSDKQLVEEYLSMWAASAFGCDPSEVLALQVLTWVAGYDNTTRTLSPTLRPTWEYGPDRYGADRPLTAS